MELGGGREEGGGVGEEGGGAGLGDRSWPEIGPFRPLITHTVSLTKVHQDMAHQYCFLNP
jgi:hypothetical protein